jgi:hypothetical protein
MAVGCSTGIFMGRRGESKHIRIPFDLLTAIVRLSEHTVVWECQEHHCASGLQQDNHPRWQ